MLTSLTSLIILSKVIYDHACNGIADSPVVSNTVIGIATIDSCKLYIVVDPTVPPNKTDIEALVESDAYATSDNSLIYKIFVAYERSSCYWWPYPYPIFIHGLRTNSAECRPLVSIIKKS